jgi:hypothetical protein
MDQEFDASLPCTAHDVHASLRSLVETQASKHSAWAEYAAILQTQAFFKTALPDTTADDTPSPCKKKRVVSATQEAQDGDAVGSGAASLAGAVASRVCDLCGGAVPAISVRVACLDGDKMDVTVPQRGRILDVKTEIGLQRDLDPGLILDLFREGTENALPDAGRLDGLGLGDGSVLFMLQRQGSATLLSCQSPALTIMLHHPSCCHRCRCTPQPGAGWTSAARSS